MSTTNWNSSSASLHRKSADDCIAALHTWAEAVRLRERDKALARLASADDRTIEVIDDLSRVLTKKILTDATASIRACAEEGDRGTAEALVQALTRGTTGAASPVSKNTPVARSCRDREPVPEPPWCPGTKKHANARTGRFSLAKKKNEKGFFPDPGHRVLRMPSLQGE